jgi:type II secretion system protein G
MKMKKAFTLIELLIVVAIIAILAAIAVPNFLEAQTRAKVSRAKSDMRTSATALEAYMVDNNKYPFCHRFGIALSNLDNSPSVVLESLSTPIAYITTAAFKDPFLYKGRFSAASAQATAALASATPITAATDRAALYNTYIYQAWNDIQRCSLPGDSFTDPNDLSKSMKPNAWILHSVGPDGNYYNLGGILSSDGVDAVQYCSDLIYDATNGTVSRGSIFRNGGQRYGLRSADPGYKAGAGLMKAVDSQK